MIRKILSMVFTGILVIGIFSVSAQTAVQRHGWLKTEGGYLLNEKGNIVQLKGMSFFWSRGDWYSGNIADFYSTSMVNFLVDQWKCTVVRVAYACDGGSCQGWEHCQRVIDAAIAKGIYVIIDWHAHDAHSHEGAAVSFFTEKANLYKNTPNVIFEPYNEPKWAGGAVAEDGSTTNALITWGAIKPYLKNVTKAIRATGSKNLVILGTPFYCQHPQLAASDPVKDDNGNQFENVAYSFHFYAASHGPSARYVSSQGGGMESEYLNAALGRVPVFITEWGTSHADGGLNYHEIDGTNTTWWFNNYINGQYKLSTCNWSVSNWQASSCFSGGSTSNPSPSGQIVKQILSQTTDEFEPPWKSGNVGDARDSVFTMPDGHAAIGINRQWGTGIRKEAARFRDKDDIDFHGSRDYWLSISTQGSTNWVSYKLNSTATSSKFVLRYLAKSGSGKVEVFFDDNKVGDINVQRNDSWVSAVLDMNASVGAHTLKLNFVATTDSGYKVGWFELTDNFVDVEHGAVKMVRSDIKVVSGSKGFNISFPSAHGYSSYTLLRADGRTFRSSAIPHGISDMSLQDLANGMWFLKLEGVQGNKLFKTMVIGK